jgi:aspartyl-tRNA(Asn)/glutamyl-tRNA(Gln) amidotransferase subunit A
MAGGRCAELDAGPSLADALRAIDERNGELRAFTYVDREPEGSGPLVSVKDVIHVAGMPTRGGSDGYESAPDTDAVSVARLRAAGFRIIGKTETHELALGVTTPQSRNPYDSSKLAGGSSGGAAIAVATGMCAIGLGTDTRASIRVPAALCGVVGFKPTYGTVPVDGVVTLSWTMDHVAPIAATVTGAAAALELLQQSSLGPCVGASVARLRIGVVDSGFEGCDPAVVEACTQARKSLEAAGAVCISAGMLDAEGLDLCNHAGLVISRSEAAAFHRARGTDLDALTDETAGQLEAASRLTATDYLHAQRVRWLLAQRLVGEAGDLEIDAWLLPTAPVTAPSASEASRYLTILSRNAIPWSLTGLPAISVPAPAPGLPVGLQLTAPPGGEATLVALASAVEAAQQ